MIFPLATNELEETFQELLRVRSRITLRDASLILADYTLENLVPSDFYLPNNSELVPWSPYLTNLIQTYHQQKFIDVVLPFNPFSSKITIAIMGSKEEVLPSENLELVLLAGDKYFKGKLSQIHSSIKQNPSLYRQRLQNSLGAKVF